MQFTLLPLYPAWLLLLAIQAIAIDMHVHALMALASAGALMCTGVAFGWGARDRMSKRGERKRSPKPPEF